MSELNIIERAFQIAEECGSIAEVERTLTREGYSQVKAHLAGRQIRSEIMARLNPNLKDLVPSKRHDSRRGGEDRARTGADATTIG
jgi:hypothetical protein